LPGFGQTNWPNSLLGFPSLFPGPISAEEPTANTLQREEKSLVEKELNSTTLTNSSSIPQQFVGIRVEQYNTIPFLYFPFKARFNPPIFEEISRLFCYPLQFILFFIPLLQTVFSTMRPNIFKFVHKNNVSLKAVFDYTLSALLAFRGHGPSL